MAKSTLNPPPPALTSSKQAATFDYRVSTSKLKRIQLEEWVRGRNLIDLEKLSSASTGVIAHSLTFNYTIGRAGEPCDTFNDMVGASACPRHQADFACRAGTGTGSLPPRPRSIT